MLQDELLQELDVGKATLVAVSKTKPNEDILKLYEQGHRDFGENRVQELTDKHDTLPKDIRWHQIGHLQTNKVKYITPFIHLIHSVDSLKVLKEINKRARQDERVIDCLLQFHIAEEESKYGFTLETAKAALESEAYAKMQHIRLTGVMGIATYTDDEEQVRSEFRRLRQIFGTLKSDYFAEAEHFKEISMGMSGDYKIALEEGSTMVRIGSLIFGARDGH